MTMAEHDMESSSDIAIVGMAGRFPGADSVSRLWEVLRAGESGISRFTDNELRSAGVRGDLLADSTYVRAGSVLDDIDLFDADFFGLPPMEAKILDPQQRLFLECTWAALEDAACDPARFTGAIGVFGGSAWSTYLTSNLAKRPDVLDTMGELAIALANEKDSLATRVAHTFGLSGPAFAVQSYCSTSLVAIATAASSLANGECDMALAGGVSVAVPHRVGYLYQQGGMTSPDGRCRAFDANGAGTPVGSGVGVVALRRLGDALAARDRIYGVIRGWAVNNDAGDKVGFSAPGVQGQAEVVMEALGSAGLVPGDIDYLEAHGTGTTLGDAAEIAALQKVFRGERVLLGSVKTNLGHLDRAAGVTGLIKVALALHNEELPRTLNFSEPNEQLRAGEADLRVLSTAHRWRRTDERPRRAGVSAFGIGGTNAHVVVEEAPHPPARPDSPRRHELLVWSGRTAAAADDATARLAEHVGDADLTDVAYTLQTGRRSFEHRRTAVATAGTGAAEALRAGRCLMRQEGRGDRQTGWLIAGVGEQYPGMAFDLYRAEPVFRESLDECRHVLTEILGVDPVSSFLGPRVREAGSFARMMGRGSDGPEDVTATEVIQPAVFAVEYALGALFLSWGVRPRVMAGYSVGEYVAATFAGVLSLRDALSLVAYRARLISALPGGTMAAVPLSSAEVTARIGRLGLASLDVGAENGPQLTVVSGTHDDLRTLTDSLVEEGVPARELSTTHAFHSRMLNGARSALTAWIGDEIRLSPPRIPYLSNMTGAFVTPEQATDPGYWSEHMCSPVKFVDMVSGLLRDNDLALLEIGPGQSLGAMVRGHAECARERWPLIIPTMPGAADDRSADHTITEAVGRLWLTGVAIDWEGYQKGRAPRRTDAPGYPFERKRHWIDPPAAVPETPANVVPPGRAPRALVPSWRIVERPTGISTGPCLMIPDSGGVATRLRDLLSEGGVDVRLVAPGEVGAAGPVDPAVGRTAVVVDLRPLDFDGGGDLVGLCRLLADVGTSHLPGTRVVVVTRGACAVRPADAVVPIQAAVVATCVVAGQEYPDLVVRTVDLDPGSTDLQHLLGELGATGAPEAVACRGEDRYVVDYVDAESAGAAPPPVTIRSGGTYLITGGTGDVGRLVARHLADRGAGRILLTSRTGRLPEPLPDIAAEVVVVAADVTDLDRMRSVFAEHGPVDGVIHAAGETDVSTLRPLGSVTVELLERHFAPKVRGTAVLRRLIGELPVEHRPGFCVLFSSTSMVLGGLGFASYAAANAGMSAMAVPDATTRWIAAAWDTWAPTAARIKGGLGASMAENSMSEPAALAMFDRILDAPRPSVLVVVGDLADRLGLSAATVEPVALPVADRGPRPDLAQPFAPPVSDSEREVAELWAGVLGIDGIGLDDPFFDLGGNSLLGLQMLSLAKRRFGKAFPAVTLFDAPTVRAFAALLAPPRRSVPPRAARNPVAPRSGQERIAIVGMAGRFPGAGDPAALWRNLMAGRESIASFDPAELAASGVSGMSIADPDYVPARPVLDDIRGFDAAFFGYSARAATTTDPQQRIFLEICWEALENAGYGHPAHRGPVGVFAGTNISTYLLNAQQRMRGDENINDYELVMGNDKDALATTVSYVLDLQGPSLAVQTFCSTSLVAVHLACQSLRAGEAEMAIAGGVSVRVPDRVGHLYQPGGMASPDGHVRTFDAAARGSMFGDGAAVVVLKPLADAMRDGDTIWGVIRGSAINNDGAMKVGYTAPSVAGQARVISDALAAAGVDASDVGYVEAHGTGTELGDPIEVAALTRAFGATAGTGYCPIGSVKTNVGHLDRAAGVTGLIKATLALHHQVIPPHLHFERPNPEIDFANSPFYVPTRPVPWPVDPQRLRIAGINSLGMGGTNVHIVVEEAVVREADRTRRRRHHVVPLSARTESALAPMCTRLRDALAAEPTTDLADVAHTLQVGRKTFPHRAVAVSSGVADLIGTLTDGDLLRRTDPGEGRPVAFAFGSGEPHPDLIADLRENEPEFRARLGECVAVLAGTGGAPGLIDLLNGERASAHDGVAGIGDGTEVVRPALFAVEYSLARTLMAWGIQPTAMIGHGFGKYVAACLSGVLSLTDALRLVSHQAPLVDELTEWIGENITLHAPVTPYLSDVTGEPVDVALVRDPGYWARHLCETGRSDDGAHALVTDPELVVVEIGPAGEPVDSTGQWPMVVASLPARGDERPADRVLAECVARLWLLGVSVDWKAHHGASADPDGPPPVRRIPLPTYPFERQEYWLDPDTSTKDMSGASVFDRVGALPRLPESDWLFLPVWHQKPGAPAPADGPWLVYADDVFTDDVLHETRLAGSSGGDVVRVFPGDRFAATDEGYRLRPGSVADTVALLSALRGKGKLPRRVVHLWTLSRAAAEDESTAIDRGFRTLAALARAAGEAGMDSWSLDIVTTGTQNVMAGDVVDPGMAMLIGPCRVIPLESPGVTTRLIDVPAAGPDAASEIAAELVRAPDEQVVALRGGRRWVNRFAPLPGEPEGTAVRPGGVYLITGGLGGLGLAMAERLARDYQARLVLMSRTGLPTGDADEDGAMSRRVAGVRALTDLGSQVEIVVGDASREDDLRRAVRVAMTRFGALHGVLHLAGAPGMGLMQFKDTDGDPDVLGPKTSGTSALGRVLALDGPDEVPLDFLVLFSSITSATGGGPGQVDYCAANAYLDAFAERYNTSARRVVAIDWGEWRWNAWERGLDGYEPKLREFFRNNRARFGIEFDEGWQSLLRALSTGESRVIVSTQDFAAIAELSTSFTTDVVGGRGRDGSGGKRHSRPELVTEYFAPQTPTEQLIADLWGETLRLDRIGLIDNFFELGGNSLVGLDLVARLRRYFGLDELAPHVIYEAPTTETLAALIDRKLGDPDGDGQAVEHQTDRQVRAELRRTGQAGQARQRRRAGR